jgi:FtsZ-binding cell division protein ZapB
MNTKALISFLQTLDIDKHHVDLYAFGERVQHKHAINDDLISLIHELTNEIEKVDVFVAQSNRRRLLKTFESQNNANFTPMTHQNNANFTPISSQNPTIQVPNLGGLEGYLINDLKEKNKELKDENKDLKRENKDLERKVFQLEKTLEIQEKDFEIERMEIEGEAKGGLNGFLEKASSNDKFMDVLGTVLGRIVGQEPSVEQVQQQQIVEGQNTEIRKNVDSWLSKIEEEKAKNIYSILMLIYKNEGLEHQILEQNAGVK